MHIDRMHEKKRVNAHNGKRKKDLWDQHIN